MASLGEQETAGRQNSDSRRNHTSHCYRGTSSVSRRPHRTICGLSGAKKRVLGTRLGFSESRDDSARPPDGHVGEIRELGGRRASGLPAVVVMDPSVTTGHYMHAKVSELE